MSSGRISFSTIVRRYWSLLAAAAIATCLLPFIGHGARAAEETVNRVATMAVPNLPFASFDIAFYDPLQDIYLLADRTSKNLDVFDAATLKPLFHVDGFVGAATVCPGHSVSDCSGPNGVGTSGNFAWVGDGGSKVRIVNLQTKKIIQTINTGGTFRADEVAVDPRDNIFVIANDADDPPFLTFISTLPPHNVLAHLKFPSATNGMEQPVWSGPLGFFYQAIPELNHSGQGAIAQISPKTFKVINYFKVPCGAAGLALGPKNQALIGCNDGPVRVIDLSNGRLLAKFPTIANADEVWYNPGDNHYYAAAGSDPTGPVLGVIDATALTADNTVKSIAGNHAVAADSLRNNIFLPSRADPEDGFCILGCIKVYHSGTADTDDAM